MVRKELGGYFPEEVEKQVFFGYLYAAITKKEQLEMKKQQLEAKRKRFGRKR